MNAATITRQSKSNLALAFVSLGRERKRDITVFYAFCRVIDDIADSPQLSAVEKRVRLAKWRQMLHTAAQDEPLLARDVRQLIAKYSLPLRMLEEIIAGVEMDLKYAAISYLRSAAGLLLSSCQCRRSGKHRDFWLPQSTLQTIRDRAGVGFANYQYHP